ncbi:MAG: putative purple acid phosphatase precursor [Gammaproteobacteria bacterium]|nr:putative purple acid phosphatase precursor [Gammaproteobacteria bacterium]
MVDTTNNTNNAVIGLCFLFALSLQVCAAHAAQPDPAVPPTTPATPAADPVSVPDAGLGNPIVFVVYGDMRFTDSSETVAAAPGPRRALVAKVASEHPDALFLTGDVPWHGGDKADYRVFDQETTLWREQHLRLYPVLGNHEFSECEVADCLENWWQAFPEFRGHRWYSVALGAKVRAFALDSNSSLLPGSEQRQWLEQQIDALPGDVRFVVITLHHPPVADQGFLIVRSNERTLTRYLKTIAGRSPTRFIVCSGHVHNYERFERDKVTYLVSGGGGAKPFAAFRGRADRYRVPGFPNFHYIRFELQGEHLTAEMVRLEDYDKPSPHLWETKDRFELWAKAR